MPHFNPIRPSHPVCSVQPSRIGCNGGLCLYRPHLRSVFLDTVGREVTIRRPVEYDANGWPSQTGAKSLPIEAGQVGPGEALRLSGWAFGGHGAAAGSADTAKPCVLACDHSRVRGAAAQG